MGFSYFKGDNWTDVTRDERFFCAHLYFELLNNSLLFLELLKSENIIDEAEVNPELWEVGYEVCFYRDFIYKFGYQQKTKIGKTEYSNLGKRTFDLCLFSDKRIIIIEVKAQQGFDNKQMDSFKDDIHLMKNLIGHNIDILLLGLASKKYNPKEGTKANFKKFLNWQQLYELYPNELFLKANNTFRK